MGRPTILSVCILALGICGCEIDNPCDDDQFVRFGGCFPCPPESKPIKNSCQCDDEEQMYDDATQSCISPPGAGTVAAADGGNRIDGSEGPDFAPLCADFCGFGKECVLDNGSVAGLLEAELTELGLLEGDISGCLEECEADASSATDEAALECLSRARTTATCAGGSDFAGGFEALDVFNTCCGAEPNSSTCLKLCDSLGSNALVGPQLTYCP
jgi:hypothetical protein